MRPLLLLALVLSTSSFACDKQGAPPPGGTAGNTAGNTAGMVENPPAPVEAKPVEGPKNLVACGDKTCAEGEQCISYYGIAGPRGPQFHECGIRCKQGAANDGCADGKKCTTIADGPGPVCR
jgi:hypothetical protein